MQPIKWHGGKHYLASRIVQLMPPHTHYVEPYAGGLAVLLARDGEGVSEVVNDIDRELTNFWRVLQRPAEFRRLKKRLDATPFSEVEWNDARSTTLDAVDRAAEFFIRCRMSLAGRRTSFAPVSRNRTRRGMNEQVSAWLTAIEGLPAVHARLKRVLILGHNATGVITGHDGPNTLFYLDPPYLHETRVSTDTYEHEMSVDDHRDLLATLAGIHGKFLLSGYDSELYRDYEARYGWTRVEFDLPNNAAGGTTKRRQREIVWRNYP